jgi:Fuc2NAc and GlcNAc transferase
MKSPEYSAILVIFLLASLVSSLFVLLAMKLAHRMDMLDLPGERQSHTLPTVTGAGAGIIMALVTGSLIAARFFLVSGPWLQIVLPCIFLLMLMGLKDDRDGLPALPRLFVQLLVSLLLLAFLTDFGQSANWLYIPAAALGITWIMNFYNFMDGSHGMAGFQGVFSGLILAGLFLNDNQPALALPAVLLAACCAGFLPFNFPRPKVFMGDSGSVPLGFSIAALMVLGLEAGTLSLPVAMLVLAVFMVDSSLTLFGTVIRGEKWYTAHKQHMYQRLIGQGWPHSQVLLLYQAINIILVVPVVMLATTYPEHAWLLAGTSFLVLTAAWYKASLTLGVQR